MKKRTILIISIFSLIFTFVFAELFSIYKFGSTPTLLTLLYLISIFAIFEYLSISIFYIISKLLKKEKIGIKKIIGLTLLFLAIILILLFIIVIDVDWLNWYANSSPFYLNVIFRSVEFLLPALILILISIKLFKSRINKL